MENLWDCKNFSKNKIFYLRQNTVEALNNKPVKALGNLSPSQISSEWDDVKVREAQSRNKIKVYEKPNWQTHNENQKNYLESKKVL